MAEAHTEFPPKYRPDIDGLRAVAVLAVVGFHAYPGVARSGFIGVDVFFVVSGFLITTIILNGLARDKFSFAEFYSRRIRRIFPALIVILLAVFVLGWLILTADEYQQLGLHVIGGTTFSSNFVLWHESGYFDVSSERKVLLHLWSLAIEEQFYLLFPLVLWLTHKRRLPPLAIVVVIGAISFIWNIHAASVNPVMDFFSPQTRIWELMVGAMLACMSIRKPKDIADNAIANLASITGALLLGLGAVLISKSDLFPSWWALLPTLGTALLISGGANAWVNRQILSSRALVWFGLISFPLYLWHWPLLSFTYIQQGGTPSRALKLFIVGISIILAWLTYRFVEKPLRFRASGRTVVAGLLASMIVLGGMGLAVYESGGFKSRYVAQKLDTFLKTAHLSERDGNCFGVDVTDEGAKEGFCKIGDPKIRPAIFAYGDSHALSMIPALAKYAEETHTSMLFTGRSVCPPLLGVQTQRDKLLSGHYCNVPNQDIFAYVKDNGIRNVLLIARWSYYNDGYIQRDASAHVTMDDSRVTNPEISTQSLQYGLEQTIDAYRKIGVHVYILIDNPLQKYYPSDALRKSDFTDDSINTFSLTAPEQIADQGPMARLLTNYASDTTTVLNFTDIFCNNGICPLVKDGKFLYGDLDHLSDNGSLLIYPELKKSLTSRLPDVRK